jgi:hypothetical protein
MKPEPTDQEIALDAFATFCMISAAIAAIALIVLLYA